MKNSISEDYMSKSHRRIIFIILIALILSAILLSIVLAEIRYKNKINRSAADISSTIPVEMTVPVSSEV